MDELDKRTLIVIEALMTGLRVPYKKMGIGIHRGL